MECYDHTEAFYEGLSFVLACLIGVLFLIIVVANLCLKGER